MLLYDSLYIGEENHPKLSAVYLLAFLSNIDKRPLLRSIFFIDNSILDVKNYPKFISMYAWENVDTVET